MISKKKIYGVKGLMEWIAAIPCGKATVTVPFTGGSLSAYGIVPAQYTTENPMMQAVIEKSDYYKNGKIILVREMEGSGKYHLPGQAATASAILDSPLNPDYKAGANAQGTVTDGPAGDAAETGAGPGADAQCTVAGRTDGEASGTVTVVEVTDIDEARDYLVEKFGIARSTIRYKSNVLKEAEERKVKFVGLDEE